MTNDIRRINEFFIGVNQKLERGGIFIGVVETIDQRSKRKFSKYPICLGKFFRCLDFVWTRVFPKMPVLKKVYFMIHGKNRRVLSQYELLGRLSFCGFDIVSIKEIEQKLYFISRKARLPREDKNPSFGPIFKQRRIGLQGEVIYTYKFRTMHPYSEYIHKYMYERFSLNHMGKIRDDARITSWGRLLRRYWLDEIPMLINLLRGDLKLVGVRPISYSFLSIYPEDLKRERIKHRPGLIPALYADRPQSITEILESERRYILKYSAHPLRTDITYFLKIMYNIIVRGHRSL
jgi:lipopolysaccharide/colanic/teichoic acid biosynthesis glycosyltransferase